MATNTELAQLQALGRSISGIVNGGNYVAFFQCKELLDAHDLEGAIVAINKLYNEAQLHKDDVRRVDEWSEAWTEIAENIWYGVEANDGDEPNRMPLTQEAIERLSQYRKEMEELLGKLVDKEAAIYAFDWSQNTRRYIELDDYIVMWVYRFIILNPDGSAYLLHGSSSD